MNRRKTLAILVASVLFFMVVLTGNTLAGNNDDANGHDGSAPNSGDGVSDGSGYDSPNGPASDGNSDEGNDGPAPNSGDGNSDGPGW